MNITRGGLIAVAVVAIITLLVPIYVTVIVPIVSLRLLLLFRTTAHDDHLSSQAVLFRLRNIIFSALCVLAQCQKSSTSSREPG